MDRPRAHEDADSSRVPSGFWVSALAVSSMVMIYDRAKALDAGPWLHLLLAAALILSLVVAATAFSVAWGLENSRRVKLRLGMLLVGCGLFVAAVLIAAANIWDLPALLFPLGAVLLYAASADRRFLPEGHALWWLSKRKQTWN